MIYLFIDRALSECYFWLIANCSQHVCLIKAKGIIYDQPLKIQAVLFTRGRWIKRFKTPRIMGTSGQFSKSVISLDQFLISKLNWKEHIKPYSFSRRSFLFGSVGESKAKLGQSYGCTLKDWLLKPRLDGVCGVFGGSTFWYWLARKERVLRNDRRGFYNDHHSNI